MLKYEDCRIRKLQVEDLAIVLKWRNSPTIRKNMYTDQIITPAEHLSWFNNAQVSEDRCLLIFLFCGQPLGVVNVTRIDGINSTCHWGFYIGEREAPRGAGLAMGYLGLEYIFSQLKINELCSEAFRFNTASIRYHEKLGFHMEDCLKKQRIKNGKIEDIVCFKMCRQDWERDKDEFWRKCFERKDIDARYIN